MRSNSVIRLLILSLTYFNLVASDLIINALTSDENGDSRFQCWQMPNPFEEHSAIKPSHMSLGFHTIGPGERRGLQSTTRPGLSFVLTGKCHVWLPDESEELWLGREDPVGLVVADVHGKGHYAWYHSIRPSSEIHVNFSDDIMPAHTVLYNGTCQARDQRSISDPQLLATLRTQFEPRLHELLESMSKDVESLLHNQHPVSRPTIEATTAASTGRVYSTTTVSTCNSTPESTVTISRSITYCRVCGEEAKQFTTTPATTAATTAKASTVDAIWREVHFTEQAQQQPFV